MKKIIIIGAGAFSREVLWLIEEINNAKNEWEVLGFLDDNLENKGKMEMLEKKLLINLKIGNLQF